MFIDGKLNSHHQSQPLIKDINILVHIGIGGPRYRRHPWHTTWRAGPHRAVREFEVMTDAARPAGRSTQ
jgi:hypothetical protein